MKYLRSLILVSIGSFKKCLLIDRELGIYAASIANLGSVTFLDTYLQIDI